MNNNNQKPTGPEKIFQAGVISATIWNNESENKFGKPFSFKSVSFSKRYKKGNEWKTSTTFSADDLPKLAFVVNEAFRYTLSPNNVAIESE